MKYTFKDAKNVPFFYYFLMTPISSPCTPHRVFLLQRVLSSVLVNKKLRNVQVAITTPTTGGARAQKVESALFGN